MRFGLLASAMALVVASLFLAPPARAADGGWTPPVGWEPGEGTRGSTTRDGPRFEGLVYFQPVRLHLSLGGYVEGVFGGADSTTGEVLLVLPASRFRVSFQLIDSVTPLGAAGMIHETGDLKEILDDRHTERRLMPTWRSHVGVALSLLAPGTGQFLQTKDREFGFLFMGLELFMAAGALLAGFAAPGLERQERIGIVATFATVGVGVSITAAIHAFQTGRESREVEVESTAPARSRGRPVP